MKVLHTIVSVVLLVSCSDGPSNNVKNEDSSEGEVTVDCNAEFANPVLNTIVRDYLLFLNERQSGEAKNYYTYLSFYKKNNDSLFAIGSSRVLPSSIDGTRAWVYFFRCGNNTILISDNVENPIGARFYVDQGFHKYVEDTIRRPIYDGEYTEDIEWYYRFSGDSIVLEKKKGGLW